MMKCSILIVVAVMVCAVPEVSASSFQGLGDLPGWYFYSKAWAVSADGLVAVGDSRSEQSTYGGDEAFRWTIDGGMVGLGFLVDPCTWPLFNSNAYGISADGSVVVGSSCGAYCPNICWGYDEAFRWTTSGGMQGLGCLDGIIPSPWTGTSTACGVSADGSIVVGYSSSTSGEQAFRWTTSGGMQGLGFLSGGGWSRAYGVSADGSVVVGQSHSTSGAQAFYWTAIEGMRGLGTLSGGESRAYAVSADGSVVVGYSGSEAFRWTESEGMQGLGFLLPGLGYGSEARGVSGNGSVVVGSSWWAYGQDAFIWDADHGMRDLKELLTNNYGLDLTGWMLQEATAISPDGKTIVGYGTNPSNDTEAWIASLIIEGDFDNDSDVDFADLEKFTEHWLKTTCIQPYGCEGTDLDNDTDVDFSDFAIFSQYWFEGTTP